MIPLPCKKKPRGLMIATSEVELHWLPASSLVSTTALDVRRANYPGFSPELVDALSNRAVAETGAAAELPVDPEASLADACLVERLDSLRADVQTARERLERAKIASDAAGRAQSAMPKPLGPFVLLIIHLAVIVCTVSVMAAVAFLLAPSADTYLLHSYLTTTLDAEPGRFGSMVALCFSAACATALLGTQLVAVLATRGSLHAGIKALFVGFDLAFAGAFAVMRLADEFSWQAVAVSVFEFAISGAGTLLLLAVAKMLRWCTHRGIVNAKIG